MKDFIFEQYVPMKKRSTRNESKNQTFDTSRLNPIRNENKKRKVDEMIDLDYYDVGHATQKVGNAQVPRSLISNVSLSVGEELNIFEQANVIVDISYQEIDMMRKMIDEYVSEIRSLQASKMELINYVSESRKIMAKLGKEIELLDVTNRQLELSRDNANIETSQLRETLSDYSKELVELQARKAEMESYVREASDFLVRRNNEIAILEHKNQMMEKYCDDLTLEYAKPHQDFDTDINMVMSLQDENADLKIALEQTTEQLTRINAERDRYLDKNQLLTNSKCANRECSKRESLLVALVNQRNSFLMEKCNFDINKSKTQNLEIARLYQIIELKNKEITSLKEENTSLKQQVDNSLSITKESNVDNAQYQQQNNNFINQFDSFKDSSDAAHNVEQKSLYTIEEILDLFDTSVDDDFDCGINLNMSN